MRDPSLAPLCIVIAGPNGSGKTTFAREYLARNAHVINFVNADLIASGLSPLAPARAALMAARLTLAEIDRLARERQDFAFESTLAGRGYVSRLKELKRAGYHIEIVFLRVASSGLVLKRISARVRQGGHAVPRADVLRRFKRSLDNFESLYRPLADSWAIYDNSGPIPLLIECGP
jgi:predicted ABC-type ATPase